MARVVGVDRAAIVRIELGRAPLRYKEARAILHFLEGNPVWVATGHGSPRPGFMLPLASDLRIDESTKFSEVFDAHLSKYLLASSEPPKAGQDKAGTEIPLSASIRHDLIGVLTERLQRWFREVPEASLVEFMQSLVKFGDLMIIHHGRDDWKRELVRRGYMDALDTPPRALRSGRAGAEPGERKVLTHVAASGKLPPVKSQLKNLRADLARLTAEPGKKTKLADFLGAPLTSVSRWLSGEREPGGETTLQMLRWVQEQERQQNTLGSAINTAKGKTQVSKSSYEKPTKVRKKG